MCKKYAIIRQVEKMPYYDKLYKDELASNARNIKGTQFGNEGSFLRPSRMIYSATRGS